MKRFASLWRPQAPSRHLWGFTLVEMLVAMTLLSLLVLAMGSALRATAQTEERVDPTPRDLPRCH